MCLRKINMAPLVGHISLLEISFTEKKEPQISMASFWLTSQITSSNNNLIKINTLILYYISYPSLLYTKSLTCFSEVKVLESAKGV